MRMAIADPPYLGRGIRWYGGGRGHFKTEGTRADEHPEAAEWDVPERHQQLVADLMSEYEGWAIAASADSLPVYLAVTSPDVRVAIWHRPNAMPSGSRITNAWEPLLFRTPPSLRGRDTAPGCQDVLVEGVNVKAGFLGHKPAKWTRWVLALLGYDSGRDELFDLFPGSGAVTAAADGLLPNWRNVEDETDDEG
jgi:hypothetical protein